MNLVEQIQTRIRARDYISADHALRSGMAKDPENADFFYLRGILRSYQNRLKESVDDLKRALHIDPKHTDAAICLSVVLNDFGKYDEAKRIFEQANQSVLLKKNFQDDSQVNRRFAIKHFEIGDLYLRYRRFDEAIDEFTRAANLDPSMIDARIRRSKAYAKKGFLMRAIQELQQLKSENPGNLAVKVQLGLLHYSQGNHLDAELEWESILEVDPTHREALSYLETSRSRGRGRDLLDRR